MKKLFSYILIFALGMATAAGAIFSPRAFAYAADGETSAQATTEIFLPTTYLQYYKLEKPYAICREEIDGKEFVAISHKGAIVLYSDGKFKEIKVEDLNAAQGVPSLQLYEQKYLLFSAGSKLWTIDTETNIATETEIAGNDFSICGNELAIATSSNISFYTLSTSSGGLGYAKETDKTISMNGVLSVLKSKNGKTYFFNTNTNTIHSVADGETDVNKIETLKKVEGVRSLAESGDESDENIYYSCVDGIFAVNTSTKTDTTIKLNETGDAADKDLGKFWQPQGICLTGKGIWVVDSEINAVQEINLTPDEKGNYNFTDFAITTNSRAINRLSVNAADVAYANGTVYALDENRIVVIENADGDKDSRTYHLIDLPVNAEKFAVGGGYLAYQRSEKQITYGKIASQKETEEKTAAAVLEDGTYTAEFDTDSSMFHVNEACEGKGTLTVKDGVMTIHVSMPSKNIVNLYPGLAEDAQKEGAELLQPTTDTVTYSDGMTEEVNGFDVPVPALDEEFDLALIGTKGTWYDHKVSVSNPEKIEEQ